MSRVELPSGAWVELRPKGSVTERQRRPVRLAMQSLTPGATAFLSDVRRPKGDDPAAAQEYERAAVAAFTAADTQIMWDVNDLVAAGSVAAASFLTDGEACTVDHLTGLSGPDYDAVVAATIDRAPEFLGVDFEERREDRTGPTTPSSA